MNLQGNTGKTKIFEIVSADSHEIQPSVYVIDLNKIKEVFEPLGGNPTLIQKQLSAALQGFSLNNSIDIKAAVTLENAAYIPATTLAHIKWPGDVPQFRVLVTNPQKDSVADSPASPPQRIAPKVAVMGQNPSAANAEQIPLEQIEISSPSVSSSDPEASRQTYSGLTMGVEHASTAGAVVYAGAGLYNKDMASSNNRHQYQLYEIWINDILVGSYGSTGKWVWTASIPNPASCFTFLDPSKPITTDDALKNPAGLTYLQTLPELNNPPVAVAVSTKNLQQALPTSLVKPDEKGSYSIRIRTAPSMKDVQTYYAKQQTTSLFKNLKPPSGAITARDQKGNSDVQLAFRKEFGCSSSVALWTVLKRNLAVDGTHGFSDNDLSVYYAPTPFAPSKVKTLVDKSPTCAAMWRIAYNGGSYAMDKDHTALAQELPKLAPGTAADFLLPYDMGPADTAQSQGYFRTLVYYGGDNGGIQGQQWVPLYSVNLAESNPLPAPPAPPNDAKFLPAPSSTPKDKDFIDWRVRDGADAPSFAVDELIYGNTNLSPLRGRITLDAHYREKLGIGLLYVEFDSPDQRGNIVGSYGSIVGMGDVRDLASDAERVASWGYYLVAPGDQDWWKVPLCPPDWAAHYSKSVTLGNTSFRLYTLVPTYSSGRSSTQTQTFAPADSKLENGVAFTFNLNFAAAVTTNVDEAATWGGDPVEGGGSLAGASCRPDDYELEYEICQKSVPQQFLPANA